MDDRIRVEEQAKDRIQQLADCSEKTSMRIVDRRVFECVWHRSGGGVLGLAFASPLLQLLQEVRADVPRVENRLQPSGGQLLDLLGRQVDAVPLDYAGTNIAHDLLDIDVFSARCLGLRCFWRACLLSTLRAPIRTPPPPVEIAASPASLPRPLLVVFHRYLVSPEERSRPRFHELQDANRSGAGIRHLSGREASTAGA